MRFTLVGYEFLRDHLNLSAFPCSVPARISNAPKIRERAGFLEVPETVAPLTHDTLEHVLFALKHEGINLQILCQAMRRIPMDKIVSAVTNHPASKYVRMAAYLWEQFSGQEINDVPSATGPYVDLFDDTKYLTGRRQRNTKWRIDFNGLGNMHWCPTVKKTESIKNLLSKNTLKCAQEFVREMDSNMRDRAMSWSYLSETESSFAIEREAPSNSKTQAFTDLLKRAKDKSPVTEDYLVQLQNLAMTDKARFDVQFRNRLNWLRGAGGGVLAVTYIPPEPTLIPDLMAQIMNLVNDPPQDVNPLVVGSLASFAFVFTHPFMDGNGRLSRFLFHKVVCKSEVLDQGLVLPISIAMKRNESAYLEALKSFSAQARKNWDVMMIDEFNYEFKFKGDPSIYRFWDATKCVEFGLEMAEQSLQVDLKKECEFLKNFDYVFKNVNDQIDVENNILSLMIRICLKNNGEFSNNKRKMFLEKGIKEFALNLIESCAKDLNYDNAEIESPSD